MRRESSEKLVNEYFPEESRCLDWKDGRALDTPSGRAKLVKHLSAMANSEGGTVVIGIREEEDGGLRLDHFPDDSEAKAQLTRVANDLTEPPLGNTLYVKFVRVHGRRVLRADVDAVAIGQEIKFVGSGEITSGFYYRPGDHTEKMAPGVWRRRSHEARLAPSPREQGNDERSPIRVAAPLEVASAPPRTDARLSAPPHRLRFRAADSANLVFGEGGGMETFGRRLSYQLSATWHAGGGSMYGELVRAAEKHLGLRTGRDFAYLVRQGRRVQHGRTARHFVEDASHVERVVRSLLGGHPSDVDDRLTHVENFRPVVLAYAPCDHGLFYVGTYKGRGSVGVLLQDIPFDAQGLHAFFDAVGTTPHSYRQIADTHRLRLGHQFAWPNQPVLRNPVMKRLDPNWEYGICVVADNPLAGKQEAIVEQFGSSSDDWMVQAFAERLASFDRIPFDAAGGGSVEGSEARVQAFYVSYIDQPVPWFMVKAYCRIP